MGLHRFHLFRAARKLGRNVAPTFLTLPAITLPLTAGAVVAFTPGNVVGLPVPTVTTQIMVNGISVGAGPYTAQIGDVIKIRHTATNEVGTVTVDSAEAIAAGVPVGRLTISGQEIRDTDNSVFLPKGFCYGHGELVRPGDIAETAAMGGNTVRLNVRLWGDYGGGFQVDGQNIGAPGRIDPSYLTMLDWQIEEALAAGLKVIIAMDSNCGQGKDDGQTSCTIDGQINQNFWTTLGATQRQYFREATRFLAARWMNKVTFWEPLVEPQAALANQANTWALQEEFMDEVLAVDPGMLFIIGHQPNYGANYIDKAFKPAWGEVGNRFKDKIILTANLLSGNVVSDANRVDRIAKIVAAKVAANVPGIVQQLASDSSADPDDSKIVAAMTSLSANGVGFTIWEHTTLYEGSFGIYYLSNVNNPNSARILKPARKAAFQAQFSASTVENSWAESRLLAANMGPNFEYNTPIHVNLLHSGRCWCPLDVNSGFGYANVELKSDGYPAAGTSSVMVFRAEVLDNMAGDLLFECTGDFTSGGASIQNYGEGSFLVAPSYNSGTGKTTATVRIPSGQNGSGTIALRFNNAPANFGALKLHMPGYPLNTTAKFTAEAIAHFGLFALLRYMDWLDTNGPDGAWPGGGNQDTDWATSRAAASGSALGYKHSLAACFDFATATDTDSWVNIPARFTTSAINSFVDACHALAPSGRTVYIEVNANEPWNFGLGESTAYTDLRNASMLAADARAGVGEIVSVSRASNVVTLVLGSAPPAGVTVGDSVYFQCKNGELDPGTFTLTSVSGSTLQWAQVGSDVASVVIEDDNTFIYLDPTNALVRPLSVYRQPEQPTPYYVKIRYEYARTKVAYDRIAAIGQTARLKVVTGSWAAQPHNYVPALLWALEEYGSLSWLHSVTPALYAEPASPGASMTTVDAVFAQLDASMTEVMGRATRWNNLMLSLGLTPIGYEAGFHTHFDGGNEDCKAAILAAHKDPRAKTRIKTWWQSWRNRGGGVLCYFHAGVQMDATGANSTWPITYDSITNDPTSQKYQAFVELAEESCDPVQEAGVNFGTINLVDVLPADNSLLGQVGSWFVVDASKAVPDLSVGTVVDADGTYALAVDACSNGETNVVATIFVDGVQVATGNLPPGSVFASAPGQAFAVSVSLTKGAHKVTIRIPGNSRSDWVGLYRVRLTA